MKERSYRRWLLHSFLLAGVVPLFICVVLILGLFQTSVERYAAGVGQRRLEAMEHGLGSFAQLCETTLQHVAEDPTVAKTLQEGTERDTAVYALLYRRTSGLLMLFLISFTAQALGVKKIPEFLSAFASVFNVLFAVMVFHMFVFVISLATIVMLKTG